MHFIQSEVLHLYYSVAFTSAFTNACHATLTIREALLHVTFFHAGDSFG